LTDYRHQASPPIQVELTEEITMFWVAFFTLLAALLGGLFAFA
jgi:hypothetical protein